VVAPVRAIEHVNAWTTGGVKDWADFATDHFKKSLSRIPLVQFMNSLNTFCMDNRPNYEPGESVAEERELFELRSKIRVSVWPGQLINVRGLVDHSSDFNEFIRITGYREVSVKSRLRWLPRRRCTAVLRSNAGVSTASSAASSDFATLLSTAAQYPRPLVNQ
jgi:hypothetical protein